MNSQTEQKINFDCSPNDMHLIACIVSRVVEMTKEKNIPVDHVTVAMDLLACHCNGCPLKLQSLLMTSDSELMDDIGGIGKNINRSNGKLNDSYRPIYAVNSH